MDSSMAENDRLLCTKPPRNQTAAKKTETPGSRKDAQLCIPGSTTVCPPPRAARGGLWLNNSIVFRTLYFGAFCLALRVFALDHPSWVYWPCFATFLAPFGLNFILFTITWLDICKYEIKNPEQAKRA